MLDKNGTVLKVGDKINVVLNCGLGFVTYHTGVVGDQTPPSYSTYECYFDDGGGCFVYAKEIEKVV